MGQQQPRSNDDSSLGKVFAVIGVVAALATGGQQDMDGGGVIILMIFFGAIGYAIGKWVEIVIIRILFIVTAIIMFLMNMAIRRFIWELISGIFGG